MAKHEVVILAAGMGSRLGRSLPKPLTKLHDGRTIMEQQRSNVELVFGQGQRIRTVVGYRSEEILERFSGPFVHNESYDRTNTSKSLLKALKAVPKSKGVLWFNGDVVFHPYILDEAKLSMERGESFVAVNRGRVGEEEVKYTLREDGAIEKLSKTVERGLGEAVGINYVAPQDRHWLEHHLKAVEAQAYFERAIELSIEHNGAKFMPLDVSHYYAVEVDFADDLILANTTSQLWSTKESQK